MVAVMVTGMRVVADAVDVGVVVGGVVVDAGYVAVVVGGVVVHGRVKGYHRHHKVKGRRDGVPVRNCEADTVQKTVLSIVAVKEHVFAEKKLL